MDISSLQNNATIKLIRDAIDDSVRDVYIIGGALRDILLEHEARDFDFVVFGDIALFTEKVSELLARPLIRIGKKDKEVIRIVKDGATYDFTPAKGKSLAEDIRRRDFTINALCYSLKSDEVIDLCGARDDIAYKKIRVVSDSAFDDDHLRMLRAFRFHATLEFKIVEDTEYQIYKKKPAIGEIVGERIREELFKIFAVSDSFKTINAMANSGLLYEIFPELKDSVGCEQNDYHHLDVMKHVLDAYKNLEDILSRLFEFFPVIHGQLEETLSKDGLVSQLKYAMLLHDVAKPQTKSAGDDGRVHFYGHCEKGGEIAHEINKRLKLSNKEDVFVRNVIRQHLRIVPLLKLMDDEGITKKAILRYFLKLGDIGLYVILHNLADLIASRGINRASESEIKKVLAISNLMLDEYFNDFLVRRKNPPLITGQYLIETLGLTPSPLFKGILYAVYKKQIAGDITTIEEAEKFVKTHYLNK